MHDAVVVLLALGVVGLAVAAIVLYVRLAILRGQIQGEAERRWQQWRAADLEALRLQYQNDLVRTNQQHEMLVEQSAQNRFAEWRSTYEPQIRQDAIERSRAVIAGKVTEHIVPYLPHFRFNPKDARFLGSPVDLVVFDGLDEGEVQRIVFLEIKTGTSTLTTRERRIRDAIRAHRVEWEEIRVPAATLGSDGEAVGGS